MVVKYFDDTGAASPARLRLSQDDRPSNRAKDLVDLALIAAVEKPEAAALRDAIETTFARRSTHARPQALPLPPSEWAPQFQRLATQVGVTSDLRAGHLTRQRCFIRCLRMRYATVDGIRPSVSGRPSSLISYVVVMLHVLRRQTGCHRFELRPPLIPSQESSGALSIIKLTIHYEGGI